MSQIDYETPKKTSNVFLTQTFALLIDAYRQVNANKLFWITLALSILVAAAFGLIGFGPQGMTIPYFGTVIPPAFFAYTEPQTFYRSMFVSFGVAIWLTWAQIILALISTANIFPDLLSGGSVDLYLSKPISRLRLFLTKYCFGLTFAALQAAAFTVAAFFVLGLRGGLWDLRIFLAIPIVTLFFSFLFCVSVLIGVVTRSALAAILITMLLWLGLFVLNFAEGGLLLVRTASEVQLQQIDESIKQINAEEARWTAAPEKAPGTTFQETRLQIREGLLEARPEMARAAGQLQLAHRVAFGLKAPLPKTSETTELMRRWVVGDDDLAEVTGQPSSSPPQPRHDGRRPPLDVEEASVQLEFRERVNSRSVLYILGTSLAFETIVVLLAAWIFARRDY